MVLNFIKNIWELLPVKFDGHWQLQAITLNNPPFKQGLIVQVKICNVVVCVFVPETEAIALIAWVETVVVVAIAVVLSQNRPLN